MKSLLLLVTVSVVLCSCSSLYYGYLPGTDYKMLEPREKIDLQGRSFNIEFRDSRGGRDRIDCSGFPLDRNNELEGELGMRYLQEYVKVMIERSNGKIDPASPNRIVVEVEGLSFNLVGAGYAVVHGFVQFKAESARFGKTYCSAMNDNDQDSPMKWYSLTTRRSASRMMVSGSVRRGEEEFVKDLAAGKY